MTLKKKKDLLTDEQRQELIEVYRFFTNEELCKMFRIKPSQLKTQVARLGLTRKRES